MNWAIAADNTVVVARFFALFLRQKSKITSKSTNDKWQKNGGVFKGQHFG